MRSVDATQVEAHVLSTWIEKAREFSRQLLEAESDAERIEELIDKGSELWRELKSRLSRVMGGKCWYCESRQGRSDNAVDHFRPKGRIAEETGHPGYWWLAFDYRNYRYACTFCNSRRTDVESGGAGGKHDHFPIASDGIRAWSPRDSLEAERHLLLDPCQPGDAGMLWFDETGIPRVHPDFADVPEVEERVRNSIELYHWRQEDLLTQRRLAFRNISDLCKDADELWREYEASKSSTKLLQWSRLVARIATLKSQWAENSAVAKCALLGLRTVSPSARRALEVT